MADPVATAASRTAARPAGARPRPGAPVAWSPRPSPPPAVAPPLPSLPPAAALGSAKPRGIQVTSSWPAERAATVPSASPRRTASATAAIPPPKRWTRRSTTMPSPMAVPAGGPVVADVEPGRLLVDGLLQPGGGLPGGGGERHQRRRRPGRLGLLVEQGQDSGHRRGLARSRPARHDRQRPQHRRRRRQPLPVGPLVATARPAVLPLVPAGGAGQGREQPLEPGADQGEVDAADGVLRPDGEVGGHLPFLPP